MGRSMQNCCAEITNVVDWLQHIGMVVNSSKTEAIYFSKHDQVGLNIEVGSIKIQVGTSMRVLGVIFDSKLSREKHIVLYCLFGPNKHTET